MSKMHIILAAAIAFSAPTIGFTAGQAPSAQQPSASLELASAIQSALDRALAAAPKNDFDAARVAALSAMQSVIIQAALDPVATQGALSQIRTNSRAGQSAVDLLRARVQLATIECPAPRSETQQVEGGKRSGPRGTTRASSEGAKIDQRCEGLSVTAIGGAGDFLSSPLSITGVGGSDYQASVP